MATRNSILSDRVKSLKGIMHEFIGEQWKGSLYPERILIIELVQRNRITREEGDNILDMLKSKNEKDRELGLEMLENLK